MARWAWRRDADAAKASSNPLARHAAPSYPKPAPAPKAWHPINFRKPSGGGGRPSVGAGLSTDSDPAGEHCRGRVGQNIKRIIKIARGVRRGTGNPAFHKIQCPCHLVHGSPNSRRKRTGPQSRSPSNWPVSYPCQRPGRRDTCGRDGTARPDSQNICRIVEHFVGVHDVGLDDLGWAPCSACQASRECHQAPHAASVRE
jgi:hypothetical protein